MKRKESKSDQAYHILEEKIVTLELPPGLVVSELELADRLKLGRTPVREALQKLAQEYLVEVMPRKGIRVTEIDVKAQLRLLEAREEIEKLLVRLASKRATPNERVAFEKIANQMRESAKAKDELAFVRLDKEYNELLAESADNAYASAMLNQLHGLARRFWHAENRGENNLEKAAALHANTADAIAEANEEKAQKKCSEHMAFLIAFAKASLDR